MTPALLVRDLSEEELLGRILPILAAGDGAGVVGPGMVGLVGPGDDGAVVAAPDGRFVVTTDVLVEDHHFRLAWSTGEDIGWRAAIQNLADIVAMGACPTSLVVSLVVPAGSPVTLVEGLARGLAAACRTVGASVVGGDLSAGESLVVAVTAHGDLAGRDPILRSGATAGDTVAVAGTLGRSAAGLALLEAGQVPAPSLTSHDGGVLAGLVDAYRRPSPPLSADTRGATAMLDVSDGLLRDAGRLALASGVGINLRSADLAADIQAVRGAAALLAAPANRGGLGAGDPYDIARAWVLTGGEDHALLATFPSGRPLPDPFRAVGVATAGPGGVRLEGSVPPVVWAGWDHFRGR